MTLIVQYLLNSWGLRNDICSLGLKNDICDSSASLFEWIIIDSALEIWSAIVMHFFFVPEVNISPMADQNL